MNHNHAHTQTGRVTVRRDRMPTRLPWLVDDTGDLYPTRTTVAAFTRHTDAMDYARRYATRRHAERKAAADAYARQLADQFAHTMGMDPNKVTITHHRDTYARHTRDILAALKGTPLL